LRTTDDDRDRLDIADPAGRREFLGGLVGTGATLAVVWTSLGCKKGAAPKKPTQEAEAAKPVPPDLTIPTSVDGFGVVDIVPENEIASITIMALLSAVFPTHEGLPNALQVGVHEYMARTLSEPRFHGVRTLLAKATAALNQEALKKHNAVLARIPCPQRVDVLKAARKKRSKRVPWALFQDAFMDFAMEGYLGHPARGGNTEGAVWAKLKIPIAGKAFHFSDYSNVGS
jgi:hypothetical protein